jgi:hypothetical protein
MKWRRATRDDRDLAFAWALAAAGAAILTPLARVLAGAMPPCPLHALTGVPCPGCGSTRAALALAGADVLEAVAFNPLAALAGLVFLVGGFVAPAWVLWSGPLPVVPQPLPLRLRLVAGLAFAANWSYLLVRGV